MNNVEKLRNYFLGKDPQLKETMADNSLRLIGIEGKHFVLRTELLKRLIDLKKQVDDKDEELQANIDAVIEDLSGEQEARIADDETLQGNIDAEASTRLGADLALDGRVDTLETDTSTLLASVPYTALTQDIRIYENNPVIAGLSGTGWYYTGEHVVYFEDSVEPAWNENTIFYYSDDGEEKYLTFFPDTMANGYEILKAIMWWNIEENKWIFDGWWVTYSISPDSTDNQIPTAAAVAQTLIDNFQAKFVTVLSGDMTLTPDIADGLYYTGTHTVKYNGGTVIPVYTLFSSKNYSLGIAIKTVEMQNPTHTRTIGYLSSTQTWSFGEEDYITNNNLAQTINSSSSNTEVPSAKAVYDLHNKLSCVVAQRSTSSILTITTAWSAGQVKVPLESLYLNYGGDYTLTNDGTIKVGAKPKIVKITSQISPYGFATGSHSFSVGIKRKRNGIVETLGGTEQVATASQLTFAFSIITDVQENDEIYTAIGTSNPTKTISTGVGKFVMIETLSYEAQS